MQTKTVTQGFLARLSMLSAIEYHENRTAMTLADYYQDALNVAGYNDIVEHLPYLKSVANGKRILELGVRGGFSTRAFLAGLPKSLTSVDIARFEFPEGLAAAAAREGIRWSWRKRDSRTPINREFDIGFFDTLHTYSHLGDEFRTHASKIKELIICHDTVTNGERGEDGSIPGLMRAIEELDGWRVKHHFENNNGLTVLERIPNGEA